MVETKENNSDERRIRDKKIEDSWTGEMSYKRIDFSRSFLLHSNNIALYKNRKEFFKLVRVCVFFFL